MAVGAQSALEGVCNGCFQLIWGGLFPWPFYSNKNTHDLFLGYIQCLVFSADASCSWQLQCLGVYTATQALPSQFHARLLGSSTQKDQPCYILRANLSGFQLLHSACMQRHQHMDIAKFCSWSRVEPHALESELQQVLRARAGESGETRFQPNLLKQDPLCSHILPFK